MPAFGEWDGVDTNTLPSVMYWNWGRDLYHDTSDTPKSALQDHTKYVWRHDKFWSYLMWEPLRSPGSIPVPIRLDVWTWRGATAKLATNTVPGTWTRTGYTDARAGLGDDYFIHPIWETNVVADTWMGLRTTNAFWYATP
jgi:hypothetical protein